MTLMCWGKDFGSTRVAIAMSVDTTDMPANPDQPMVQLFATPKGNGYQATVAFLDGVSISSQETYPTIAEAITAAATKLLDMTERLDALDRRT